MTDATSYELKVSEDGTLTLPPELKAELGLLPGDSITVVRADEGLWFVPSRLLVPELARRMRQLMAEKGLTVEDMMQGLEEEGEKLFQEQYGHLISS